MQADGGLLRVGVDGDLDVAERRSHEIETFQDGTAFGHATHRPPMAFDVNESVGMLAEEE